MASDFDIIYWDMREYILERFKEAGFNIDEGQAEKFARFYALLAEWNSRINLTALTSPEDVVLKHFIDSAYGAKYIEEGAMVCDVGSGAGFPSIPLRILRGDIKLTMVDSVGKKVDFLREAVKRLGLEECQCLQARAEDAARGSLRESFDVVCVRAVAGMSALCEYCLPLVKVGGLFLAYKGDAERELEAAKNAIRILGGQIDKVDRFFLQGTDHKRTLILIRKVMPTDKKYPRGQGKEKKNPL